MLVVAGILPLAGTAILFALGGRIEPIKELTCKTT
jgi:hypothetical protein